MKFVFPQNYNFKSKLFGILDYSTAIFDLFWITLIFFISNLFFNNLGSKIFYTITLGFPIFLFSLIGFNNENFLYVIFYFIKFLLMPKLYLFNKD